MHRSKDRRYSMTSSAASSGLGPTFPVPAQDQRLNLRTRRGSLSLSTGKLLWDRNTGHGFETAQLPMRYARTLLIVATVAFAWSAAAIENADELAGYCQSLER